MEDNKPDFDEIDKLVKQRVELNRQTRVKNGNPSYNPLTSVSTGAGELKAQFDYIKQYTGESTYLTTPADRVRSNMVKAQYNEAKKRSQDQGIMSETAAFLAQTVAGEILLGIGNGIGYALDVTHWGDQLMGGEGHWGNWFSDAMEEGQEWIRDVAPIYEDPDNADRGMFENMLHGDGWWAANGVSVASSLSILIPVAGWAKGVSLIGKIGKGAKSAARIGKWGNTVARATKTVDNVGDAMHSIGKSLKLTGDGTKAAVSGIHKATVSRLIESQMEATAVFKEKFEEYQLPVSEGGAGMTEDEAKAAAGKAAAFTYKWNWAAMVTDLPQYMLMGASGKTLKKVLNKKKPGFITNSKLLNKTKGFRSTAFTMATEGAEEAFQYIVGEEGKRMGDIEAGIVDPDHTSLSERLKDYSKEAELHTSAFFGALGGGVFSAAGPAASGLINKAFRKGELAQTAKDVRLQEMNTRHTRLAHNMDLINTAVQKGDEEAIFTAKTNMAFDIAKEAISANNWGKAREAIAQLKHATKEEKDTYGLDESFEDFITESDLWLSNMDKAADIIERNRFKYTHGLDTLVSRLEFSKQMYDVQAPKIRAKKDQELKAAISNIDSLSKDGNVAIEAAIDIRGQELAIKNLEKLKKAAKTQEEVDNFTEDIERATNFVASRKEALKKITDDSDALNEDDRMALDAVNGGSADSAVSLDAKAKLLSNSNRRNQLDLNRWTSHEGRRLYKELRAEQYKQAKLEAKKKKESEEASNAKMEAAGQSSTTTANKAEKNIDDLNIGAVSEAIKKGGKYEDYSSDPAEISRLKELVGNYNMEHTNDPDITQEELDEDLLISEKDEIEFVEELEESIEELEDVTDDVDDVDPELERDATEQLNSELDSNTSDIEVPMDHATESHWRAGDDINDPRLSAMPSQLAWLSSNNELNENPTPEHRALTSYLESPGSMLNNVELEFVMNNEWVVDPKNTRSDLHKKMLRGMTNQVLPSNDDIGFLPITAVFMENGQPVMHQGFPMKMNLHDVDFYYDKNGNAKNIATSDYQAKVTILHKRAIATQMLAGGKVVTKIKGKSNGKLNIEVKPDGTFAKNYVAQTLKKPMGRVEFLVGSKTTGNYMTADKRIRMPKLKSAEPGAIYVMTETANGSQFPLRMQVSNISKDEGTVIHAIYSDLLREPNLASAPISEHIADYIDKSTDPRVAAMKEYMPDVSTMTYQDLLSHLVYEGSRTMAKKDHVLTHFVNIKSGGNALPNVVQFGKTKMPSERFDHIDGKAEFIEWLMANKRRQVDATRLNNDAYKAYINDTQIVSTNAKSTPEGNLFIQPVISYATKMRVDNKAQEHIIEEAPTTKEEALIGLQEDLAMELGEFGNPETAKEIENQIKALQGKLKHKNKKVTKTTTSFQEDYDDAKPEKKDENTREFIKGDVTIRFSPTPTYIYTKKELKQATGELMEVEIVNTSAPVHKGISQLIDLNTGKTIATSWRGSGKMFQSGKSTTELMEIILDGLTIQEVIGTDLHTALQTQKTLPTAKPIQETSEIKEVANTVASTIKMFQTGVKTEKGEEITVNLPDSSEFPENLC